MTHIWLTGQCYHPCLALCLSLDDSVLVMTYTSIIYDLCCYLYPFGIVFVPRSVGALPLDVTFGIIMRQRVWCLVS
jgi:hypothetical protein